MKTYFRILLYLSLIFVVYYLYRFDYIQVQGIDINYSWLVVATVFLWAGFVMSTISWWNALAVHKINTSIKSGIISHGLSVFAKYIPGKIWVILGRASYISVDGPSIRVTSYISLKEQLIYLWLGLVISAGPLFYFYPLNWMVFLVLFLTIAFTVFLFVKKIHEGIIKLLSRLIKKELDFPLVTFKEILPVVWYILAYWILWIVAFYFFVSAFGEPFAIGVVFSWPLSISLGVLALVIPGGIGVREGILTGFMIMTGMAIEIATTIAIVSRLWFISGEIFLFLLALTLNRFRIHHR